MKEAETVPASMEESMSVLGRQQAADSLAFVFKKHLFFSLNQINTNLTYINGKNSVFKRKLWEKKV